ncbi:hypothetical protein V6N13_110241 [Hibiscus sabdariffa]|uniref:Uncharacterized protein n=2 Tax=Hibiscus sabdariffa TaxID=183260 RepID=A0ABR2AF82_9ROSI
METTQKKGFFKRKLPKSFSRVLTKPSSGTDHHNMAKTSYSMLPMLSDRPTTGFHGHKVASYFKPPPSFYDQNGYGNERWGSGDENVDSMAASYISNVRQRFQLGDGVLDN